MQTMESLGASTLPATAPRQLELAHPLLQKLLMPRALQDLYGRIQERPGVPFWRALLDDLQVEYDVSPSERKRLPATGPTVVVANHPFGLLEAAVICDLTSQVRPDVRVLTNYLVARLPELREHTIPIDPFGGKKAAAMNRRGLRAALAWLQRGGMLVIFPAGEVSSWNSRELRVVDPEWTSTAARLICSTGACAVPLFVDGHNSLPFHLLGLLHRRLRTVRLPHELLNKRGNRVQLRIGGPLPCTDLADLESDAAATRYLRWRTYLLGERASSPVAPREDVSSVPVAPPRCPSGARAEIRTLPVLHEDREFTVHVAQGAEAPELLYELGRARETTFRGAGEGTGRAMDLDDFDGHYHHLILWHKQRDALAGAYRLGHVNRILEARGLDGLYTNTLFRYHPEFFARLGSALELGRSFVVPEHQRSYSALLGLWKGLGRYVAAAPEAPILMGAVSISSTYRPASRELIVRYFERDAEASALARLVQPRTPFCGVNDGAGPKNQDMAAGCAALGSMETLAAAINDIEADSKGVPVLLRQYVKLGGRLLSFNVDAAFANVLDGLVLVDLRQTDPRVLERTMGAVGHRVFAAYHGLRAAS